jgi:hypothetical protein
MIQRPHRRVRFVKVELKILRGGQCRAFVDLVHNETGDVYVGSADGRDSARLQLAATAAADAIRQIVHGTEETLVINGVEIVKVFRKRSVVVAATVSYENQVGYVQGICAVGEDVHRAAVFAVLHATNRFLGLS